VEIETGRTNA
jgi:hypothetical protein